VEYLHAPAVSVQSDPDPEWTDRPIRSLRHIEYLPWITGKSLGDGLSAYGPWAIVNADDTIDSAWGSLEVAAGVFLDLEEAGAKWGQTWRTAPEDSDDLIH
jgi:hypothetical protein